MTATCGARTDLDYGSGNAGVGSGVASASGSGSPSGSGVNTGSGASGGSIAVSGVACGESSGAVSCNGGCLCFSTPETCPTGCYPEHDATGAFICNGAPMNANDCATDSDCPGGNPTTKATYFGALNFLFWPAHLSDGEIVLRRPRP